MPACASPAIASPATTATAIGRNSGSTMRQRGQRVERAVGQHGGQERRAPRPGRGPRSVTARRTATRVGSAQSSADRHPGARPAEQLAQLDGDHADRRPPGRELGAGRRQHHLLEGPPLGRSSRTRTPAATSTRVQLGRVGVRGRAAGRRREARPGRRAAPRAAAGSGVRTTAAGRARVSAARSLLQHQPARGRSPRPGCTAARPRRAGGWTGRPSCRPRCSSSSSVADLADALRVQPVGRLVEHQQPGRRSSAAASPSRCRMPSE